MRAGLRGAGALYIGGMCALDGRWLEWNARAKYLIFRQA